MNNHRLARYATVALALTASASPRASAPAPSAWSCSASAPSASLAGAPHWATRDAPWGAAPPAGPLPRAAGGVSVRADRPDRLFKLQTLAAMFRPSIVV